MSGCCFRGRAPFFGRSRDHHQRMRVLLYAVAALVVAVLIDAMLYDSRYLNAASRMIADSFARLLSG
jgi:hypothetical protein